MADFDRCEELLDRCRDALAGGDLAAAETAARAALRGLGDSQDDRALGLCIEAKLVLAWTANERGETERALSWLAKVRELDPDDPEALLLEGSVRLRRWELEPAAELLARCEPMDDQQAAALCYERAFLADLQQRFAEADELYRQAHRLEPEAFALPVRMGDDEARQLLADLIAEFPADVRAALDNLRIDLVDVPSAAIEGRQGQDPSLLGIYDGVPLTEQVDAPLRLPGCVRIFKRNLEREAADRDHLIDELRVTLLHEVGHHLGWDEDDLEQRGLE
jgi:predicted Zn-dependent protease with MMP-like domain